MSIRVFHFILDHRIGGPHVYVQNLAQRLAPKFRSYLLTTGNREAAQIRLFNFRHLWNFLYLPEVILNLLWILKYFWHRQSRKDVIFDVHGVGNVAPIFAARLLGVPLVWHFHETTDRFTALSVLGRWAASGVPHRIVTVAKKSIEIFNLKDATLIPGAIDPVFWSAKKSESTLSETAGPLRILVVSNLNPLKGIDLLLDCLEEIMAPWELMIVGAELGTHANYAKRLRRQAARLESSSTITRFLGWQSPEQIRTLMQRSDVFVLASRSEACPLFLLEAMAAGCVSIATDVGDVREILNVRGSGFVVEIESPSALAEALKSVMNMSPNERKQMGKLAQEVAISRYSLADQARAHLAIYEELINASEGKE